VNRTVVGLLLAASAAAWDQNEDLLSASRKGDLASVRALVEKGADLETKTSYGQTPIYIAAMQGHLLVVEFLLSKGANAEVRDTFYKGRVIDFAMMRKHHDVVKLLLTKKAVDPDPSFVSMVTNARADIVQAAIDTGKVKPETLTRGLELATDQKKNDIVEILQKAGAKPPEPAMVIDAKILESYTGTYKTDQFPLEIKAWVRDGKLMMQVTGQPEFTPRPKSEKIFNFAAVGAEFEFQNADTFTLKQGGFTGVFKKVAAK